MGRLRMHANVARFQRLPLNKTKEVKDVSGVSKSSAGVSSNANGSNVCQTSYVGIVKQKEMQQQSFDEESISSLVLDEPRVLQCDYSFSLMGKVKEFGSLVNLKVILIKEGFDNFSLKYLGGFWVLIEFLSKKELENFKKHVGVASWFSSLEYASNSFVIDERVVWVDIEGVPLKVWTHMFWIRAKEVCGWVSDFLDEEEGDDESDEDTLDNDGGNVDMEENMHVNSEDDSDRDVVQETVFSHCEVESKLEGDSIHKEEAIKSDDPFQIYDLLQKKKRCDIIEEEISNSTLKYPPGFTPVENVNNSGDQVDSSNKEEEECNKNNSQNDKFIREKSKRGTFHMKEADKESCCSGHFRSVEGPHTGGSILQLLEDLVKVGQTMGYKMDGLAQKAKKGWIKELCIKNKVNFLSLQETKMEKVDQFCIKNCWGNLSFEFVCGPSIGNSGGILCVWDPRMFRKHNSTVSDYFVAVQGDWIPSAKKCLIISIYAPQEFSEKKMLWSYLNHVIDNWSGEVILMGDFNEVRSKEERFGTNFNKHNAIAFNSFISSGGLVEVPLGGCAFTWCHKSGSKMSKLDRFLISEGLMGSCPNITAITLDRFLSDHRPILLREACYDYGPTPFRFFHYWFEWEGFDKFIGDTWSNANISDDNAINKFMKKMRFLKEQIRGWVRSKKEKDCMTRSNLIGTLNDIDLLIDDKKVDCELLNKRSEVLNSLQDLEKLESLELAQKAKIKWSIEGDENSKYFHDPNLVKEEFLSHFKNRFDRSCSSRLLLDMSYPNRLSPDQIEILERNVSKEEIKRAVWDCGIDKSPSPDGFTFGFYRRYWDMIENDVVEAVSYFFTEGKFPKGGNASFIALIPKMQDANVVKDFRPICLIGSMYKIIAKILANRLVLVLGELISEVQSAFIANRQILDGPFILDELIHWCKSKKKQTMIFKVDFEKAYDSVRWDYLDDVLDKFGFGLKWRDWIHNCLISSKGSILVNGSPTGEFHFRKGLKQGDPLSSFLFLLVMESLHISFQNVVLEGLFKGLDCFHKALGLRMNLHKSKIMGIAVDVEIMVRAANKMGCSSLKTPFSYLGIKVGGSMSRKDSWNDIVDNLRSRLSKWKMKTLSIGGRLTLIKSVLGSTPIYYMSMFKVPSQILKCLEDIRRKFFHGVDTKENKMSWVKWGRVLASKEKGGLGISSFFALNRALLLKWVWRFRNNKDTLWSRFISAMYGNTGRIEKPSKVGYNSAWLSIVSEFHKLQNLDIDLLSFMKKRVGNGVDTAFWEDQWLGDEYFKTRFHRVYALESDKKISVAAKMSHHDLGFSLRRSPRDGVEQEQFSLLKSSIEGVVMPDIKDRWIWSLAGAGDFSVASARKYIDDLRLPSSPYKTRWLKVVPKKINVLAWKVRFDFLPTRLNLSRRGVDLHYILCPNCNVEVESTSHVFFACSMMKDLYRKIFTWWDLSHSEFRSYDDWFEWLQSIRMHSKLKDLLEGVFYVVWWLVWNFRNKSLFDSRYPSKAIIFDVLVSCSFYWCRAIATHFSVRNPSVKVVSDRFATELHSPPILVVAYVPAISFPLVVAPALASPFLILLSFGRYPLATVLSSLPTLAPTLYQVTSHRKA
ncbi:RNA-directed DNA polymerase, eukaryota [Tanacetum coccineum]